MTEQEVFDKCGCYCHECEFNPYCLDKPETVSNGSAVKQNPEAIKGYNKLSPENQTMFKQFLRAYMSQWSDQESHWPIKVSAKHDRSNGHYLRVDFPNMWLHVRNAYIWY